MTRIVTSRIHEAALAFGLVVVPSVSSQQPTTTVAPVPAQIVAAKKVFISNAGADPVSQATFKRAGEPDQAYNRFYAAVQTWGRYELVSTPGQADLVFEIRFTAPMYMNGSLPIYEPQFCLKVLDAKTHFLLWNLAEPVNGAFRKATWQNNFGNGLHALMNDLKKLSPESPAAGDAGKN